MKRIASRAAIGALFAFGAASAGNAGGVSDDEIRLGMITDLSGPIAQYGKESVNGANMAIDEINARGGIHGRKLTLAVEDHGYEPRRAVLAAQKLVTQNDVFAILAHLGTATNMAALPVLIDNKVFNIMPQGASSGLYDPPSPYKVALAPSYADVATASLDWIYKEKSPKRLCALYQDDDFGREAMIGVEAFAATKGVEIVEQTSYKRGATDFSSQMARLQAAECDIVYNASTLREFVGSVAEAKKIGFEPVHLGTTANYHILASKLGGDAMEKVYGAALIQIPYLNSENETVAAWAADYQKRFNEDPGIFSMYAYYAVTVFAAAAEAAGQDLDAESFAEALNATDLPADPLGNPAFDVSEDDRLSNRQIRVVRIQNGKWVPVSGLLDPLPR